MPPPAARTERSYHHGDLRARLLSSALETIECEGIAALSLRKLARDAGVSPAAPYHHFNVRAELLAAIIAEGHEILLARLQAAAADAPDPVAALRDILVAYATFAAEHPAHIRIMLRPELGDPAVHSEVAASGGASVELLCAAVEEAQRHGSLPPGDPEPLLHLFWSLAVGFVTLWVDGPVEARCHALGTTPPELIGSVAAAVEELMRGFGSDDRSPKPH
jgi:AcrR family transcriptional regulator